MSIYITRELVYQLWKETSKYSWSSFYRTLNKYWGQQHLMDQELLNRLIQAVDRIMLRYESFPPDEEQLYHKLAYEAG